MKKTNKHASDYHLEPRALNERQTAEYIGMSVSFLQKDRMNGLLPGRTAGPRWGKVGKRVFYLKDELDCWLEACCLDERKWH
jgi:hypothetical protein